MAALNVIFGGISLVGVVMSIYFYRRTKAMSRSRYRYEWSDIQNGVRELMREVERSGFRADFIMHSAGSPGIIANLGAIMTRQWLPIYEWMVEDPHHPWEHSPPGYTLLESTRWRIYLPDCVSALPASSNVLILDSTYLTGSTVAVVKSHLQSLGFANIKYACLLQVDQAIEPRVPADFHYFENPTNEWYWPWGKGR